MFRFFIVAVCAISLASAGHVAPEPNPNVEATQNVFVNNGGEFEIELSGDNDGGNGFEGIDINVGRVVEVPVPLPGPVIGGKGPFVDISKGGSGAELSSLARNSAIQAKNAVHNQQTAGTQAAFGATSSLATAATGAAQTAQAAVVGKQAIVYNLKKQVADAERQLQSELAQYKQLRIVVESTHEVSQKAQYEVRQLTVALAAAQSLAHEAEAAAGAAANAAASQRALVAASKQILLKYVAQLDSAIRALKDTEVSAYKAAEAAHIAQNNANAAGLAVAAAGSQGGPEIIVPKPAPVYPPPPPPFDGPGKHGKYNGKY